MPLFIGLGVGVASGVANAVGNVQKENSQKKLASETARYSPWTHLTPTTPQMASPVQDVMQGGISGMTTGQGIKQGMVQSDAMKNMGAWFGVNSGMSLNRATGEPPSTWSLDYGQKPNSGNFFGLGG